LIKAEPRLACYRRCAPRHEAGRSVLQMNGRITRASVIAGCGLSVWYLLYFAVSFSLGFFRVRLPDLFNAGTAYGSFVALPIILTGLVLLFAGPITFTRRGMRATLLSVGLIPTGFLICMWYMFSGMAGLGQ
jgi:hypothetical protein